MEKLDNSNWKQIYIGSGLHLKRVMEMYQELGYETKLELISPEEIGECSECYPPGETYKLYVRKLE